MAGAALRHLKQLPSSCWCHHVAWCWMLFNEVWFPSNIVFNIFKHFFCSKMWTTVLYSFRHRIQQCCTRECPLRWRCDYRYPWWWFIPCICFARCDVFSRFLAPGATPLETGHLLLQFPGSGTAVLFLSERVTLLLILKGTLKCQHGESLFSNLAPGIMGHSKIEN